ncbi:hypothetical protein BN1708_004276 [Verticillium longisporum]|uniref:Uncharacterized protein n=1 Tax=Verticillium longisporum TaxID=100787 RepID=A0A0G4LY72_VERLO|nr:hypothetical protein BN1708_004276 [Verticillium longisporum]
MHGRVEKEAALEIRSSAPYFSDASSDWLCQPKRHQPPPDVAQPVGGVLQALVEAEVLGNGPDGRARPAHMPGDEGARRCDVARNGLLAEDVLACRQGAADDARLHRNRETDDDGKYVGAGQEIVERGFFLVGAVIVDVWPGLDLSRDGGGCLFGSREAFGLEERTEKMIWVLGNGQREEDSSAKGWDGLCGFTYALEQKCHHQAMLPRSSWSSL